MPFILKIKKKIVLQNLLGKMASPSQSYYPILQRQLFSPLEPLPNKLFMSEGQSSDVWWSLVVHLSTIVVCKSLVLKFLCVSGFHNSGLHYRVVSWMFLWVIPQYWSLGLFPWADLLLEKPLDSPAGYKPGCQPYEYWLREENLGFLAFGM